MGVAVVIANTTRTSAVNLKTLRISSSITANASLCEFEVYSSGGSWRPKAGNELIVTTTSDALRHFAGNIIDVYERAVNRTDYHYSVQAKDYTWLFDRRSVARDNSTQVYAAQAASAIVADIVTTFTTGFSTAGIQVAPSVAAQRYNYVAPSAAIKGLADQIQWHFYIDYSKVVQFFSAISAIAPTTGINFDTNTADYGDLVMHESAAQIKNRIVLEGYQTASNVQLSRSFTGDSTTRFFLLGYEPAGLSTSNMTATIDGVTLDLKSDEIDGSPGSTVGSSSQVYICFSNLGARFSTAGLTPSGTQTLAFSFNYMKPGGVQQDDPAAQTVMAARSSGDGVHMYHVNDPSLTNFAQNDDLALAYGTALTTRYGQPPLEGSFHSYLAGWRAGQYFTGVSATRMGGDFSAGMTFYVNQVEKTVVQTTQLGGSLTWVHKIEFSNSEIPL